MEPPEYVVSHPLAREGVYQGLPLPEREALHASVGRALEAYHGVQHGERTATRASAMGTLGVAHLERGDPAGAIPWLEGAVEQCRHFTDRQIEGRFLVFRGEAYLRLGRLDEARRSAAAGLEMCRATGFAYGIGLGERALAEISLAANQPDEAATHFEAARDLARGQVLHSDISDRGQ